MTVLVLNAGSSSLKYSLFDMNRDAVIASGFCERIGIDGHIRQQAAGFAQYEAQVDIPDHDRAVELALNALTHYGPLKDIGSVEAVGHRVAHGGDIFKGAVSIDEKIMSHMESVAHFTPLHSRPILTCIRACMERLKDIPHVGVFDTAFHHTMPPKAFMYSIPYEYYEHHSIRRYGFHGTSYRYVCMRAEELLKRPINSMKIIACHLGNGSSVAAIENGRSIDTSMGLTPLEGLPMGTRSGDIDPAIMENIASIGNKSTSQTVSILNKESGFLGLSGISSDLRDVIGAADKGHERAALTLDVFAYRIKKYIGSYFAAMNGADALIFTAGIGENSHRIRSMACNDMDALGISIDEGKNKMLRGSGDISSENSKVKVLVIPTNEEWMIAHDAFEIANEIKT